MPAKSNMSLNSVCNSTLSTRTRQQSEDWFHPTPIGKSAFCRNCAHPFRTSVDQITQRDWKKRRKNGGRLTLLCDNFGDPTSRHPFFHSLSLSPSVSFWYSTRTKMTARPKRTFQEHWPNTSCAHWAQHRQPLTRDDCIKSMKVRRCRRPETLAIRLCSDMSCFVCEYGRGAGGVRLSV